MFSMCKQDCQGKPCVLQPSWRYLAAQVLDDNRTAVSDEELCAVLKERLNVDASEAFRSSNAGGSAAARRAHLPQKGAVQQGYKALTVEHFVTQMLPLLELERDAEVAQVKRWTYRLECAQADTCTQISLSCYEGRMSCPEPYASLDVGDSLMASTPACRPRTV